GGRLRIRLGLFHRGLAERAEGTGEIADLVAALRALGPRLEVAAGEPGHRVANAMDRTDQAALNENDPADHHDGGAAGKTDEQDELPEVDPLELRACRLGMAEIGFRQPLELLVERLAHLAVGVIVAELPRLGRRLLAGEADQLGAEADE